MATPTRVASDAANQPPDDPPQPAASAVADAAAAPAAAEGAPAGDASSSPIPPSSSTNAAAAPPPASPASGASAAPPRPQFAGSPAYVALPAPSFSYSVLPRPPPLAQAGGGVAVQQPASSPAVKLAPPMPPAALQPPVPGQYLGSRPSFSYNVVSHANASLPTGQQFQLNTAANDAIQGSRFVPPASLQPPAPGQLTRPNAAFHGAMAPNPPGSVQLPFPVPPKPSNIPFGVSPQQAPAQASQLPSNTGNMDVIGSKSDAPSAMEANPCPMQLPTSLPSNSPSTVANAAGSPSIPIPMPANPSLPPRPGVFGAVGASVPGQPPPTILPTPPSLLGRPAVPSPSPLPQTSPSVAAAAPVPQTTQQHFYPSYPSAPGMVPPQPLWGHPPQATGFQHAPFQPYPATPLGPPLARPMVGTSPVTSFPSVQPPGVPAGGGPKEPASTGPVFGQPRNALVEEPLSAGNSFAELDVLS